MQHCRETDGKKKLVMKRHHPHQQRRRLSRSRAALHQLRTKSSSFSGRIDGLEPHGRTQFTLIRSQVLVFSEFNRSCGLPICQEAMLRYLPAEFVFDVVKVGRDVREVMERYCDSADDREGVE